MYCDSITDCSLADDFLSVYLIFDDAQRTDELLVEIKLNNLTEQNKWEEISTYIHIDTESQRDFKVTITQKIVVNLIIIILM